MFPVSGFFDISGSPALKLTLHSPDSPAQSQEFDAIIDTGFTGFVLMAMNKALPLGFKKPTTTTDVELADGSVNPRTLVEGTAMVEDRRVNGPIILEEEGNEVLVGMDFLRTFELVLILDSTRVMLLDEVRVKKMIRSSQSRARQELVVRQYVSPIVRILSKLFGS